VSISFLADADLNQAIVIAALAREAALDFLTATQADLEGRSDPEVLEFAASQDRILVSHDTSTMPVHFSDRLRSGRMSPGVFLVRQRASVGRVVEAILLVWSASVPGEWAGQIHYLPSLARHDFH
jgi:predicted nuclease of predicted toxin-antitoxin system